MHVCIYLFCSLRQKKNNSSRSSDAVNRCKVLEKKISISNLISKWKYAAL